MPTLTVSSVTARPEVLTSDVGGAANDGGYESGLINTLCAAGLGSVTKQQDAGAIEQGVLFTPVQLAGPLHLLATAWTPTCPLEICPLASPLPTAVIAVGLTRRFCPTASQLYPFSSHIDARRNLATPPKGRSNGHCACKQWAESKLKGCS